MGEVRWGLVAGGGGGGWEETDKVTFSKTAFVCREHTYFGAAVNIICGNPTGTSWRKPATVRSILFSLCMFQPISQTTRTNAGYVFNPGENLRKIISNPEKNNQPGGV
jgi:hypothetical protein